MNAAIIQRRIAETAHRRGFTEKHIAVMSFEIGKTISVDQLSDRQLETLLDALKREEPRIESTWDETAFDLMCKCNSFPERHGEYGRMTIWDGPDSHMRGCQFRRFLETFAAPAGILTAEDAGDAEGRSLRGER